MRNVYIFLIPLAAVLLLLAGLWLVWRHEQQQRLKQSEQGKALHAAQQRAVWAGAEVLTVRSQSGYSDSSQAALHLTLLVSGAGQKDYPATVSWLVEMALLPQIQPGKRLSVKVDPDDPQVIYPNMSGARYLGKG